MGDVNYEILVAELIKPLVTHPEDVKVITSSEDNTDIVVNVTVNPLDIGRVIGKNGRVIGAIRTIAHAAAIRCKQTIEINVDKEAN